MMNRIKQLWIKSKLYIFVVGLGVLLLASYFLFSKDKEKIKELKIDVLQAGLAKKSEVITEMIEARKDNVQLHEEEIAKIDLKINEVRELKNKSLSDSKDLTLRELGDAFKNLVL